MLITRAAEAKRVLVDLLQAQTVPLAGVQVEYSDQGQEQWRESIYLGPVTGSPGNASSSAATTTVNFDPVLRLENVSIPLYIRVIDPAGTPESTDQRAVAIAQIVQDTLAANASPFGPRSWWQVAGLELVGVRTGDEAITTLTLAVAVASYL